MSLILGVDPGLNRVGWGLVCGEKSVFTASSYGCVETSPKLDLPDRLDLIYRNLVDLIDVNRPDLVSVESLFFNTNAKTALVVGQARGVILLAAKHGGVSLVEFTPLQIKMALTGYGQADKTQIQHMVKVLLHLKETPSPDDAADGLAAALCAHFSLKLL